MANKGLRAISYQGKRKVEAGYKPLHTTELLMLFCVLGRLFISIILTHIRVPFKKWQFEV